MPPSEWKSKKGRQSVERVWPGAALTLYVKVGAMHSLLVAVGACGLIVAIFSVLGRDVGPVWKVKVTVSPPWMGPGRLWTADSVSPGYLRRIPNA